MRYTDRMDQDSLKQELQLLNQNIAKLVRRQNLWRSFFGGVLSGLGSVVGATIVVAILAYMLRNVQLVPLIGSWIGDIVTQISQPQI
mgnify:FL=1